MVAPSELRTASKLSCREIESDLSYGNGARPSCRNRPWSRGTPVSISTLLRPQHIYRHYQIQAGRKTCK